MAKDLAARLHKQEEVPVVSSPDIQSESPVKAGPGQRKDRQGLVTVAGWFPVRVKFELEEIRLERSRKLGRKVTLQEIMAEAYNDLFKKYGRAELAPMIEE
jgi:hypothetical protein